MLQRRKLGSKVFYVGCMLMFSCIGLLHAQGVEDFRLAGVEYAGYPKVAMKDDAAGYEVSFQELGAFLNVPTVLKEKKIILMNGINYGFVKNTTYNESLNYEATKTYHRIGYTFMFIDKLNEKWLLTARLAPILASDLEASLSSDDFIFQGSAIAIKKFNDYGRWGFGLIYTTRLGEPLWLPGFQYAHVKGRHAFNTFLPAFINYSYTADKKEKITLGARISVNGSNFHSSANGPFSNTQIDRLSYARVNAGPRITYRLSDMLLMDISGGMCVRRLYKFKGTTGKTYDYDSDRGTFISAGIFIAPKRKKAGQ